MASVPAPPAPPGPPLAPSEEKVPIVEDLIRAIRSINPGSPVDARISVLELCAKTLCPVAAHGLRGSGGEQQKFYIEGSRRIANRAPRPPGGGEGGDGGARLAHAESAQAISRKLSLEAMVRDVENEADASEKMLRRRTQIQGREGHRRTCERVLMRVLSRMEIFKSLNKEEIQLIVDKCRRRRFSDGEIMAQQNEEGNEFMAITIGGAKIVKDGEEIAELGVKEFVGERCLIDGTGTHKRGATVIACGDTTVMVLTKDALDSAGLDESSAKSVYMAAQRRCKQLKAQDHSRSLQNKMAKKVPTHKIEFSVDFIAPPIGLIIEGKFKTLVVRGFEEKSKLMEQISKVKIGDELVGVNGILFSARDTHRQRMSKIQHERWPLRLLFQRTQSGPGPPLPSKSAKGFEFPEPVASVNSELTNTDANQDVVIPVTTEKSDVETTPKTELVSNPEVNEIEDTNRVKDVKIRPAESQDCDY